MHHNAIGTVIVDFNLLRSVFLRQIERVLSSSIVQVEFETPLFHRFNVFLSGSGKPFDLDLTLDLKFTFRGILGDGVGDWNEGG